MDTVLPTVAITSPPAESEITSPVEIVGTATDAHFKRYDLTIAKDADGIATVLASSTTAVVNGVLGRLDPTLLENGLYHITLTALDLANNQRSVSVSYLIAGANKVGIARLSFIDLSLPLSGIPIAIVRTYDSRVKTQGDFGVGWTLDVRHGSYEHNRAPGLGWNVRSGPSSQFPHLPLPCQTQQATLSHVTEVRLSDREYYRFRAELFDPQVTDPCGARVRFAFTEGSTPGARLDILGNDLVLYDQGLSRVVEDPESIGDPSAPAFNPPLVRLTTIEGRVIDFDRAAHGITRVADANGNTLTIDGAGILHSSGRSVVFTRDGAGRITRITDPMTHELAYTYDPQGDLDSFTDQVLKQTTFVYDGHHNLQEIHDPLGRRAFEGIYDATGRLIATVDAQDHRLDFIHNVSANEELVVDSLNHVTRLVYDPRGNVVIRDQYVTLDGAAATSLSSTTSQYDAKDQETVRVDPDGIRTESSYAGVDLLTRVADVGASPHLNLASTFGYDPKGRLSSELDAASHQRAQEYDAAGNLTRFTDFAGAQTLLHHDTQGRVDRKTDALGNYTTYQNDADGHVTRQEEHASDATLLQAREYSYDANGNRLTEKLYRTVNGAVVPLTTRFDYDAKNRLVKTTDALGKEWSIEYNEIGKERARIDPLTHRTEYEYDEVGALTKTKFADGTYELETYDSVGNRIAHRDRGGRTTTYEYDEIKRLVATHFPGGATTRTAYSAGGRVVATIDARGNRTEYEYDTAGRQTKVVQPEVLDGLQNPVRPTTTSEYDAVGNRTSRQDANGNTTTFTYDAVRRLLRTIHPDSTYTERGYDPLGRLTSLRDEESRITTYGYDGLGRLVTVTAPPPLPGDTAPVTRYEYDEAGNLVVRRDALGHATTFAYDALNRQTDRMLQLGEHWHTTYDDVGKMSTRRDANGDTTSFEYDAMGRLLTRTYPDSTTVGFTYTDSGQRLTAVDARGVTTSSYDERDRLLNVLNPDGSMVAYTYDLAGNLATLTTPAGIATYAYDALNRLAGVTTSDGTTAYRYDAFGNRVRLTAPAGLVTLHDYDERNRLESIVHRDGNGGVLESFAYQTSPTNRRSRLELSDGTVETYAYDGEGRLVGEQRTGSLSRTITYEYDPSGNRTRIVRDGVPTSYSYDDDDRLLSEGSIAYQYDANGNLTRRTNGADVVAHDWDFDDRLASTTHGAATTSYVYDADGQRIEASGPAGIERYLLDRQNPTRLSQVLEERGAVGELRAAYTYGTSRLGLSTTGGHRAYGHDATGSVRVLVDPNGTITDRYSYDAYGNATSATGTTTNPYGFAGERRDSGPGVGVYDLRARRYDSRLGRFMSPDPSWVSAPLRAPVSSQPYLYANADPVDQVDPSGLDAGVASLPGLNISLGLAGQLSAAALVGLGLGQLSVDLPVEGGGAGQHVNVCGIKRIEAQARAAEWAQCAVSASAALNDGALNFGDEVSCSLPTRSDSLLDFVSISLSQSQNGDHMLTILGGQNGGAVLTYTLNLDNPPSSDANLGLPTIPIDKITDCAGQITLLAITLDGSESQTLDGRTSLVVKLRIAGPLGPPVIHEIYRYVHQFPG